MNNPQSSTFRLARTLATLGLCAASACAFAQSAEYRRGYDDGYRAGRAADSQRDYSRDGGARRGPGAGRINILDARYGVGNRACDARTSVQSIVDQQGDTPFEVSNDLCGDPAPGQHKSLDVTYQCGRNNPVRTSADETQGLRIVCR